MYVNGEALAARLRTIGRQLDAAADDIGAAITADAGYRFRPWGRRVEAHAHLAAAHEDLQRAAAGLRDVDGGFTQALEAVAGLELATTRERIMGLAAAGNRRVRASVLFKQREGIRSWAEVVRQGARLVEDPATSRAAGRDQALELARRIGGVAEPEASVFHRLAALDELPADIRPDLPFPVARSAAAAGTGIGYFLGDFRTSLDSWARRDAMRATVTDRSAAVDLLARTLDGSDSAEALRVVAALDQLPGHLRPDMPRVGEAFPWSELGGHVGPAGRDRALAELRQRLDDIRASVEFERAPDTTLARVQQALVDGSDESILQLRELPGFPAGLVARESPPNGFDRTRIRVWLDAQSLVRRSDVTREGLVDELRSAAESIEAYVAYERSGSVAAGSGAALADRLEGRPPRAQHPRDALVRIAAIDSLPAELRPDLPDLMGPSSWVNAAYRANYPSSYQSRDMLRLRAWLMQQGAAAGSGIDVPSANRSQLRRFLDPSSDADAAAALSAHEQAELLVGVLANAGDFRPRELHGALVAARRHLEHANVADDQVRPLVEQARELIERNIGFTEGRSNPGYHVHPDYAELGRVAQTIRLVRALDDIAPAGREALSW